MTVLLMTIDPGSSLTKIFYAVNAGKPEILLFEPEVIPVSRESIDAYQSSQFGNPNPEDSAWIECNGKYLIVGFLAQTQFQANPGLSELKYERAIYKVLASVGAIAEKEALPSRFSLRLGLLLPWGEYQDREQFSRLVADALKSFHFRYQQLSVSVCEFECKPEGGGLFLLRRRQLGTAFNQQNTSVVVIGYRNASILNVKRGTVIKGDTSDLGFVRLIEKVQQKTSGQKAQRLTPAIHQAGAKVQTQALAHLARSSEPRRRSLEVAQIAQAIKSARGDYWEALSNWLINSMPNELDEVMISGGTADYLRKELKSCFSHTTMTWADDIEQKINETFQQGSHFRLTDAYGFFLFMLNKQLGESKSA